MELAEAAGVKIGYEIGDFCEIDLKNYGEHFDFAYAEGGYCITSMTLKSFFQFYSRF